MSVKRARTLRKNMPPAEARMWVLLRTDPFKQYHFRRQVPLGPYFADFASHQAKLAIEIDGDTHGTQDAVAYDRRREVFMQGEGYKVQRFTNIEVMNNLEGVGMVLMSLLKGHPHPTRWGGPPSPPGGKEVV